MNWHEQETKSRRAVDVTEAKAKLFDEVKKELPVVQKEADAGVRPFQTVEFQTVKGTGFYEGEFGVKGDDVLFHLWPWGYHDHERTYADVDSSFRKRAPAFADDFEKLLRKAMGKVFGESRCEFKFDGDVGAWFVRARNFALNQFHRDLAIEALQTLYNSRASE